MKGTRERARESTQRLGRSERDTTENNDNARRGVGRGVGGKEGETMMQTLIHIT